MTDGIDYGNMMHRAMRGLVAEVLTQVAETGLPGEHHFFITFDTRHADVDMSDWLRERYPETMTIVLQHWFDDLRLDDRGFSVVLNFGDQPERLTVPMNAIVTFVDPSVEFGLRFDPQDAPEDTPSIAPLPLPDDPHPDDGSDHADASDPDTPSKAEVVSLDQFRK